MNTKMIEYQMFTKCNLGCEYCYNFFEQGVGKFDEHVDALKKISSLADTKTCMVLNGGEPLLFKNLAKLINSVEVKTNILTYTNGALPLKIYNKFVKDVKKDNLYFTVSFHYGELLKTNNFNEDYKANVKYLIQNIPNLKVNLVFTEEYGDAKFVSEVMEFLRELKEAGLKYINILLEDSLKDEPHIALKLVTTPHFKQFFKDLSIFKYKHCMWNNQDDAISCLQMWLRKECMSPRLPYKELSFLKHKDHFIVQSNFDFESPFVKDGILLDMDNFIQEIKPVLG